MTTRKAAHWPEPKLKGKTFVFTRGGEEFAGVVAAVRCEGGRIVRDVTAKVDYVVKCGYGRRQTPEEKAAQQLNARGAAIQVIDMDHLPLAFTDEEAAALLQGGKEGRRRWEQWRPSGPTVNLTGINLRGADLHQVNFEDIRLDGADLRDCKLSDCGFDTLKNVRLDGAVLQDAMLDTATASSFKKADLSGASVYISLAECDFTGANLSRLSATDIKVHGCRFRNADLTDAELNESKLKGSDFTDADLSRARLSECDFTGSTLVGACLCGADLTDAKLAGADLSRADLTNAILAGTDLKGAKVDGADFTGATMAGAKFDRVDTSKAKGFDPGQTAVVGKIGAQMRELAKVARQSRRLETQATIELPEAAVMVKVTAYDAGRFYRSETKREGFWYCSVNTSFGGGMIDVTRKFVKGRLRFDSVRVKCSKGPMKPAELKQLAVAAWAEAMGVEPPTAETLRETVQENKQAKGRLRDELIELLKSDKGVKAWNRRTADAARVGNFKRVDLSGADLTGIVFAQLNLEEAKFDGATLTRSKFTNKLGGSFGKSCNLKRASFRNVDLGKADIRGVNCSGADFSGARLAGALLEDTDCRNTLFTGADLSAATLNFADLCGADLTGATLNGTELEYAEYDGATRFPAGFTPPENMLWAGKHLNPSLIKSLAPPTAPLDFAAFIERLQAATDAGRLSKALAMLKADRFRLFAEVKDGAVTGVVKSQTDAELVYSCRLASDGTFACCTQNLKPCGGLGGALCKHLLVLLIGLTKATALDPATAHRWVEASRQRKPALDKDVMSETFLKYKGAEAGEVDWRPTETIPEDYYTV